MGSELEQQLEALKANAVNLEDRQAVRAKAFELDMHAVTDVLHYISHLKESKRAQAWSEMLRQVMPIDPPADIEDGLDADDTPDPRTESSEADPSSDSSDSSDAPEGDADPTTPSSESSESPSETPESSKEPTTEPTDTPSPSTPASPDGGGEPEKSE